MPATEPPLAYVCEGGGDVVREPLVQRAPALGMPCPDSTDRTIDCDRDTRVTPVPIVVVECDAAGNPLPGETARLPGQAEGMGPGRPGECC